MSSNLSSVVEELNRMMRDSGAKVAAKRANDEPPTSHPSGSGDNLLQTSTEGSKSKENVSMTKEVAGPASVESNTGAAPTIDQTLPNIGPVQSVSGEHPASSTSVKTTITDPGTSSPATVSGSQKYAELQKKYAGMSLPQLEVEFGRVTDEINKETKQAAFRWDEKRKKDGRGVILAPESSETVKMAGDQEKKAQAESLQALANGYALNSIKQADIMARLTAEHVRNQMPKAAQAELSRRVKKAEEEEEPTEAPKEAPAEGGGGGPPPSESGPPIPTDPAAMMGGGGGPPAPGGGGIDPAAVEELLMVLEEKGISPEELLMALQQAPDTSFVDPNQMTEVPPEMAGGAPSVAVPPEAMAEAKMAKQASIDNASAAVQRHKKGPVKWKPADNLKAAQRRQETARALDNLMSR